MQTCDLVIKVSEAVRGRPRAPTLTRHPPGFYSRLFWSLLETRQCWSRLVLRPAFWSMCGLIRR